jgi:hypothetical protein
MSALYRHVKVDSAVPVSNAKSSVPIVRLSTSPLGQFPLIAVGIGAGMVAVAIADTLARSGAGAAQLAFWLGLCLIYGPAGWRLLSSDAQRGERIALVVTMAVALYAVTVMHSPIHFTFHDEFGHWRAANTILQSHHLFRPDPLERVDPVYPGLETVTTAFSTLAGLSIFTSGLIVIGLARLILALALFLTVERIAGSARVAGVATALYMTNPTFLFFDAQFAYESLALPLAVLAIWICFRFRPGDLRQIPQRLALVTPLLVAIIVTHHLTSYMLVAFMVVWAAFEAWRDWQSKSWLWPALVGAVALVGIILWTTLVASTVLTYLVTPVRAELQAVWNLVTGHKPPKALNRSSTGKADPLWSQALSYGSVLLLVIGLPFALRRTWLDLRRVPLAWVFGLLALLYPASLAIRFVRQGTETSNRASGILFLGLGFVLAALAIRLLDRTARRAHLRLALAAAALVVFLGGITIGWAPYEIVPGQYLVGADSRSVDVHSTAAALWARQYLLPGNRILTDRSNGLLEGSYGMQDPQEGGAAGHPVADVFFSSHFTPQDQNILRADAIRYLIVDRRLTHALPLVGIYFNPTEPNAYAHRVPLATAPLDKFDHLNRVNRIFSDGHILIYDVGALSGCTGDRTVLCSPGSNDLTTSVAGH